MSAVPFSPAPWLFQQFRDTRTDVPLSGGQVTFYVSGSFVTKKDTYSSSNSSSPVTNTNPVILDSTGKPTSGAIFFGPGGYNVSVADSLGVQLYTLTAWEDVGATFSAQYALTFMTGARSVNASSPYSVLSTDNFITVTTHGTIQLPASATRSTMLGIKNLDSGGTCAVTPFGAETIDTVAAAFTLPAASSPAFPTLWIGPDPVGGAGWLIVASHKVP